MGLQTFFLHQGHWMSKASHLLVLCQSSRVHLEITWGTHNSFKHALFFSFFKTSLRKCMKDELALNKPMHEWCKWWFLVQPTVINKSCWDTWKNLFPLVKILNSTLMKGSLPLETNNLHKAFCNIGWGVESAWWLQMKKEFSFKCKILLLVLKVLVKLGKLSQPFCPWL